MRQAKPRSAHPRRDARAWEQFSCKSGKEKINIQAGTVGRDESKEQD